MLNTIYPPVRGGPPQASRIIRPGELTLPAGTERYTVVGAGAMLIEPSDGSNGDGGFIDFLGEIDGAGCEHSGEGTDRGEQALKQSGDLRSRS